MRPLNRLRQVAERAAHEAEAVERRRQAEADPASNGWTYTDSGTASEPGIWDGQGFTQDFCKNENCPKRCFYAKATTRSSRCPYCNSPPRPGRAATPVAGLVPK